MSAHLTESEAANYCNACFFEDAVFDANSRVCARAASIVLGAKRRLLLQNVDGYVQADSEDMIPAIDLLAGANITDELGREAIPKYELEERFQRGFDTLAAVSRGCANNLLMMNMQAAIYDSPVMIRPHRLFRQKDIFELVSKAQ